MNIRGNCFHIPFKIITFPACTQIWDRSLFFYNTDISISYIIRQGIKLKVKKIWQERDIKCLYKHWYIPLKNAYNIFISPEKNIYIIFGVLSKQNRSDIKKKKVRIGCLTWNLSQYPITKHHEAWDTSFWIVYFNIYKPISK